MTPLKLKQISIRLKHFFKNANAIRKISKPSNSDRTYAYCDIVLEFASWLSSEFKLYLITEFERLKKSESCKLSG